MMKRLYLLSMLALAMGVSGCASPETHYYSLAQSFANSPKDRVKKIPAEALWIEVAPVQVPERLNRQNIVVTNKDGSLKRLERDKWSAPLPDEMRDVLSQELQSFLGALDIYQWGAPDVTPVYRITTQVVHMDAELDKRASAELCWAVRRNSDEVTVTGCTQNEWSGLSGVDGVVAAYQKIVSQAALDIATGLRTMNP